MTASPNFNSRGSKDVRLVVIHTAEGARTTASLGAYFAKPSVQSSSHVGIDDDGLEQYVPYDKAAWTLRSGNAISDNAELCGWASWSRLVWLGEHRPMLERAAAWIRGRCLARGIPIVKLTPDEVRAGKAGVIGHVDWTLGMRDGTHTDPGPGFPWDVVMALATAGSGVTTPAATPAPLHEGDTGPRVAKLQAWLNRKYKSYSSIDLGPQRFGPQTVKVIAEFQRRMKIAGADADGTVIGPRTWAALIAEGYKP